MPKQLKRIWIIRPNGLKHDLDVSAFIIGKGEKEMKQEELNEMRMYFDEQMEQLKDIHRRMRKEKGIEIVGL